jgi:CRISPR type III-B/RAMP module RAMP protein Cmr1
MEKTYSIQLLTPCFCRGMDNRDDAEPEIRPASIRGHLRSWHRALFADPRAEKEIFGGVGKGAVSSPVIVRVANIQGQTSMFATLPHKEGGRAANKKGFSPGTTFELLVSTRRGGISDVHQEQLTQSIDAWLLAGGLGLRTTRAAGSIQEKNLTMDLVEYRKQLSSKLNFVGSLISFPLVLPFPYSHPEKARVKASDTIGGRDDRSGQDSLRKMNYPLGTLGSKRDGISRKTSPLRFTIREFEEGYRIISHWYGVTGEKADMKSIVKALVEKKKALGSEMYKAFQER